MKYATIDALDARVERIIKSTVKHYFTDWKHYDRPKYMKYKGSNDRREKHLILSVRTCGTYLYTEAEKEKAGTWPHTLWEYFHTQERADHYKIDLDRLTVEKLA